MVETLQSLFILEELDSVRLLIAIAHLAWQGTLIGLMAACACRLLRHAPAQARYLLLLTAMLSLPICATVTFCFTQPSSSVLAKSDTVLLAEPGEAQADPSPTAQLESGADGVVAPPPRSTTGSK